MRFTKNTHKNTIPKLNRPIHTFQKKRRLQKHGKEPVLVCSKCKTVFPEFLARCPECGSRDWQGLSEVNPYNNAPAGTIFKTLRPPYVARRLHCLHIPFMANYFER